MAAAAAGIISGHTTASIYALRGRRTSTYWRCRSADHDHDNVFGVLCFEYHIDGDGPAVAATMHELDAVGWYGRVKVKAEVLEVCRGAPQRVDKPRCQMHSIYYCLH